MSNTRKATGKPGRTVVTDFDAVLAEADYAPFVFTLGGRERELPHPRTLNFPQVKALDEGRLDDLLDGVASEVASDVLALPAFALDTLIESWLAHGGIDLGELLASADS